MKKLISVLLALTLTALPVLSLAADLTGYAIANAVVTAPEMIDVTAPFSGTLLPFDLETGDTVKANQQLMAMQTTTVYAPESGIVSAIFASLGDDASAVCQRYGCVMGIEPEHLLQVECSTIGSYYDSRNKIVHLGDTVYLRNDDNRDKKGVGRIVGISSQASPAGGTNYLVEVTTDNIEQVGYTVSVYLDDDYDNKDNIGRGATVRRADALVQAAGRVCKLYVSEGDKVTAGQPLMEIMGPDAAPTAVPEITVSADTVVANVPVAPGQQVWKGQLLARLYLTDKLEVTAQVDEMDLGRLAVGDRVIVTLDTDEDHQLEGTVTKISAIGVTKSNAAYFTVKVSIPSGNTKLGASASVYLPKR